MAHYFYYYTPCFNGSPPGFTDPESGEVWTPEPVRQPGQDTGSGPEYVENLPRGADVLKYDDPRVRCVVRIDHPFTLPGWVLKSPAEVLIDYPGLPGVV
jgi:hypothetical protein